jgi:hypothetical protein
MEDSISNHSAMTKPSKIPGPFTFWPNEEVAAPPIFKYDAFTPTFGCTASPNSRNWAKVASTRGNYFEWHTIAVFVG